MVHLDKSLIDYIIWLWELYLIILFMGGMVILTNWLIRKFDPGISVSPYGFFTPIESVTIYKWLKNNTEDVPGRRYKSTRKISEVCNLTDQQVYRGCFYSAFIFKLDDDDEEMWTIYPDENVAFSKYRNS
jgi:hypothetical protein